MQGKKQLFLYQLCSNIEETEKFIEYFYHAFLKKLEGAVLLLEGNLGSGKTTICQFLGRCMQIENIQSPSFNIYHIYETESSVLCHYDLYRLHPDEIEEMEIRELWYELYREKFTIHAIEWWQKAQDIKSHLPIFRIQIKQNINRFTERTIKIFKIFQELK